MNCPKCGVKDLERAYAPYKNDYVLLDPVNVTEVYTVLPLKSGAVEAVLNTLAKARHRCAEQ